jgi:hypothetical protein
VYGFDLVGFLMTPAGGAAVAVLAFLFGRFAPPSLVALARLIFARMPVAPPAPPRADVAPLVEVDQVEDDDAGDDVGELVAAVMEAAGHRWPELHQAEAMERFTVELRSTNHWRRDEARKAEAERVKAEAERAEAAAAAEPVTYTPAEFGSVFGGSVELYG